MTIKALKKDPNEMRVTFPLNAQIQDQWGNGRGQAYSASAREVPARRGLQALVHQLGWKGETTRNPTYA